MDAHAEIRAVAREVLRPSRASGDKADVGAPWQTFIDVGWVGLDTAEALGGAGASFAELAVILDEMGRAATPGPFFATAVLGLGALDLIAPSRHRDELVRTVVAGHATVAVALGDGHDAARGLSPTFEIERADGRVRLNGHSSFVVDGATADRILAVALDPAIGPVIVNMAPRPGLEIKPRPVLDQTRSLADVSAHGVELDEAALWSFTGDPSEGVAALCDRAALGMACDSLGLSEAMLNATVSYARTRIQFGRAIGSFQAVKHACADMLSKIRIARELRDAAVSSLVNRDPDASIAASMAKSYLTSTAVEIVGKAMQLHGGFGYTWDSNVHTYLKRATLNRSLFGSPMAHRQAIAARYRP